MASLIKVPLLNKLTHTALIKFETDYSKYIRKVADVNDGRHADYQLTVASILDCMDDKLMHA